MFLPTHEPLINVNCTNGEESNSLMDVICWKMKKVGKMVADMAEAIMKTEQENMGRQLV